MEKYVLPKIVDAGGDLSARWYVEYKFKHPETNKFVKFREWISSKLSTRTARYSKASELKNTINVKLKSGYNPFENTQRNYTLNEAFEEVLKIKNATTESRTRSTYKSISKIFLVWLHLLKYKNLRPSEFNKYHAQQFLDYALVTKKVSNRTHNNYLVAMRTLFECFFTRDYIDVNVWKKIPKLKTKETNLSFFNPDERLKIKEFLEKEHYELYCVMLLIYYCFLRPAEITRLRICDIDFRKNQIIVKGNQSKNGKTQIVIMHQNLVDSLMKLNLQNHDQNLFVFGTTKSLLPSSKKIAPTRIADVWRWYVKEKHGIKKNIYDMKPTGAGEAFDNGIDARQIQLQIRHASLEHTQIYLDKISNKPGQIFRDKMPTF
jgi:integrase/recombinase XerD